MSLFPLQQRGRAGLGMAGSGTVQFNSRWYLRAREISYALHHVSQNFPWCCLWDRCNVCLTDGVPFSSCREGSSIDGVGCVLGWRDHTNYITVSKISMIFLGVGNGTGLGMKGSRTNLRITGSGTSLWLTGSGTGPGIAGSGTGLRITLSGASLGITGSMTRLGIKGSMEVFE